MKVRQTNSNLLFVPTILAATTIVEAWIATPQNPHSAHQHQHQHQHQQQHQLDGSFLYFSNYRISIDDVRNIPVTALSAKRNRKKADGDDISQWYDPVQPDASPDDVFFQEIERQRLQSQAGMDISGDSASSANFQQLKSNKSPGNPIARNAPAAASPPSFQGITPPAQLSSSTPQLGSDPPMYKLEPPPPTMEQYKAAEATLSQYELFRLSDNWLDHDILAYLRDQEQLEFDFEDGDQQLTREEQDAMIDKQLQEWDDEDEDDDSESALPRRSLFEYTDQDEPWDLWAEPNDDDDSDEDGSTSDRLRIDPTKNQENEFLLKDDDDGDDEDSRKEQEMDLQEEREFFERLAQIEATSPRLEKARNNPKAKAFFARDPDPIQGYDTMWVCAVDNVCVQTLRGNFRSYGIDFADNFGDWEDGRPEDGLFTIEEMASFKARSVYNVTGLPCIASRTSFEVEPMPTDEMLEKANLPSAFPPGLISQSSGKSAENIKNKQIKDMGINSPRIRSGYRINEINLNVGYLVEAMLPFSEPTRVTSFKTCLCYFDGEMEVFDYGTVDVDIYFCEPMKTMISVSQAANELLKTLKLACGLEFQKFLKTHVEDVTGSLGGASMQLRDRVLKDGKVLPNDIIDVSSFMESQIDVNLMDDCAKELSARFEDTRPTKILTVATTGLVIALPMAKYLQVPVVYARKERSVVMADTFSATFTSKTVGKNRELLVSKSHLHPDDRILVIDDFLSSGASQEALLRIISDAGASCVGIGVLLEKVYDSGRRGLSGFNVPIESLCSVASVATGVIQLVEEEGYEQGGKQSSTSASSLLEEAETRKQQEREQNSGNSGGTRKTF